MSGVVTTDGTYTVTLSGALPEVDYGQYYLLGVTDSTGMLFEADETNKVLPVPIELVPGTPDLAPTQFSCNPIEVAAHESFTASWQVTNRGTGRTNGSWTDAVYLTTNGVLDGNAILLANITEQYTVSATKSYAPTVTLQLPPNTAPGNYQLLLVVDAGNQLQEQNTADKQLTTPLQVTRTLALIAAPDVASVTVQQGHTVIGAIQLTNLADVPLTPIVATPTPLPGNLQLTLQPPDAVASGQTASLIYQLTALDASALYGACDVQLTTGQGVAALLFAGWDTRHRRPGLGDFQ